MQSFTFDTRSGEYTVTLQETRRRATTGQIKTEYSLIDASGKVIFSGNDLGCSPMHTPESRENAIALLAFLTLKPGDTDEDYFKDYTPEQLAWCQGDDCEDLAMFTDEEYDEDE